MEEPDYKYQLACIIEDMEHDMAVLSMDLMKAPHKVAPCRRARVMTTRLGKTFRQFRRVSCLAGLK